MKASGAQEFVLEIVEKQINRNEAKIMLKMGTEYKKIEGQLAMAKTRTREIAQENLQKSEHKAANRV